MRIGFASGCLVLSMATGWASTAWADPWDGIYFGGSAGYVWGNVDGETTTGAGPVTSTQFDNADGADLGLHVGYRWQNKDLVTGLELGYSLRSLEEGDVNLGDTITLRGSLGLDNSGTLLFITGGLSVAQVEVTPEDLELSEDQYGFNIGVGAERMFTDRLSLRSEIIYSDLGGISGDTPTVSTDADLSTLELRLGVNLHF